MNYNKDPPLMVCSKTLVNTYIHLLYNTNTMNNNNQEKISLNPIIVFTVDTLATIKLGELLYELQHSPQYLWNEVALEMVLYSGLLIAFNFILFDHEHWVKSMSNNRFEQYLFTLAYFSIFVLHSLPFLLYFITL